MRSPHFDQCQDCGADHTQKQPHDETCVLGRALDDMRDADAAWFIDHPESTEYYRDPLPGDSVMLIGTNLVLQGVRVHVVQIEPGVRSRRIVKV